MAGYTEQDIRDSFGHHKMGDKTFAKFSQIKMKFLELSLWIKENVPNCPRQTTCINLLIDAKDKATMGFLTEAVKAGTNEE